MAAMKKSDFRKVKKLATKGGRYVYGNEDVLGRGSFGVALKATDKETGDTVAIKILEFKFMKGRDAKASAKSEVAILKKLRHDNIISILDDFKFRKWLFISKGMAIVTDYCSNGSLSDYLERYLKVHATVSEDQRLMWYKQLMYALEYLHGKSIAHRDIKPANILVDKYNKLKVADVGLSKMILTHSVTPQATLYMTTMCGTYPYTAPEVFEGHYTIKSDVFSMGLVMYVICELPARLMPQVRADKVNEDFLYKLQPYQGEVRGLGLYYEYCGKSLQPMDVMETSKSLEDERKLFNSMLQPSYQNRPGAAEVLKTLEEVEIKRKEEQEKIMLKLKNDLATAQQNLRAAQEEVHRQENNNTSCIIL